MRAGGACQAVCVVLTLLLLASTQPVLSQRALLSDALSNSNGCLDVIPKCERGGCATRNIMGTSRWTCLRCMANYEPVVDKSGQDNIVQCGKLSVPTAVGQGISIEVAVGVSATTPDQQS